MLTNPFLFYNRTNTGAPNIISLIFRYIHSLWPRTTLACKIIDVQEFTDAKATSYSHNVRKLYPSIEIEVYLIYRSLQHTALDNRLMHILLVWQSVRTCVKIQQSYTVTCPGIESIEGMYSV